MTLHEALGGIEFPVAIARQLVLLDLEFVDFTGARAVGQLVVHSALATEVREIFVEIAEAGFPIAQMLPVSHFGWSDDLSMAANNCSGFNYRPIAGKATLSQHAYGRAIDINPMQNPYVRDDLVLPPGARYEPGAAGTLDGSGAVVAAFEQRGWTWGGRWLHLKDWHHFEKLAE